MAPKEQLRSLAHPLYFLMDMLRLLTELELSQVVLHPPGKLMGARCAAWGSQMDTCKRSINCFGEILPGEGSRAEGNQLWDLLVKMELHCWGGQSTWETGSLPAARERLADAGGSAAPRYTASHMAQTGLLTLSGSSLSLGNDFSSLNLISMKHRQLFPRALKGR